MKKIVFLVSFLLLIYCGIFAEIGYSGWSGKMGYNFDTEDVSLGGELNMGTITRDVHLVPQLEIDFFGEIKKFGIASSFQYFLPTNNSFDPYVGTGLDIIHMEYDDGNVESRETDFKLHLLGGIEFHLRNNWELFFEIKTRFIDDSDTTIWAGFSI